MIAIISEYRYTNEELKRLKEQGCIVNYTLMPQYYSDYNTELTKINNKLIYQASALIFRIETFYSGTKEAIEKALYFKKKCKIIYENESYTLTDLSEWKHSYGYGADAHTFKHKLLQIYEAQRAEYYENKKLAKEKERYAVCTEGVTETEEEVYRLVNSFKHLYDIQVDMECKQDVYLAYKSIAYYLENDIEYSNEPQGEEFPYEIISFGDPTYMEDYIYQNVR
jgi:hypothetical protein